MSTKKRVLINIGLTLCLSGLVALKVIINLGKNWVLEAFFVEEETRYSFFLVIDYGIYLSALFALVTIWLPAKAKAMFGFIALRISLVMGILELGYYGFIEILALLIEGSFVYPGLDPLLTVGVVAVIYFAAATSDGFDIVKSKKNENKSQWIFFSHKEKTISAKRKQQSLTSKCRADVHENSRCYRRQEVQDQNLTQENNKTNIAKLGKMMFAAAGAMIVVFALCAVFMSSIEAVHMFSVFMSITGICIAGGAALLILDHIRKR